MTDSDCPYLERLGRFIDASILEQKTPEYLEIQEHIPTCSLCSSWIDKENVQEYLYDETEIEEMKRFGVQEITVHGYVSMDPRDNSIHLFPNCGYHNKMKDLHTITVFGSRICTGCRNRKMHYARAGKSSSASLPQ